MRSSGRGRAEAALALLVALVLLLAGGAVWFASTMAVHEDAASAGSTADPYSGRHAGAIEDARRMARAVIARDELPGLSVAVAVDGEVVWAEGFGWADPDSETKITPLTRFRLGALSKPLTAVGAALLHDRGRLALDAPVQRYVPAYPEKQWTVTTRQLMSDVAGVHRIRGDNNDAMPGEHCTSLDEAVALFAGDPLLFEPGSRHRYSIYGWVLVSAAVEGAAGEKFSRFMTRQVFEPLRMDRTVVIEREGDDGVPSSPTKMFGVRVGREKSRPDYSCLAGAGAFLSTPTDLVRLGSAMLKPGLLTAQTIKDFQTPTRLASGAPTTYALGWTVGTVRLAGAPTRIVSHRGSPMGGSVSLLTFPEHGLAVAAAANVSDARGVNELGLEVASAFARQSKGVQTSPDRDAKVDALFAEWNTRESPGCGVGVGKKGAVLFERGYGMANLERRIPISASTIFDPASIAKPFTALSIMLLAEQGKLSLDDEVWKHVPEWANRRDRITIRHLLAHTAGLRDVFLLIELVPPRPPGVDINEHILRTLARQRGGNFAPSTEFSYNNGGYNLLATIVGRVSGQPFREFAAAQILQPLGMTRSSFRGSPVSVSREHALGYHGDGRGFGLAREGGIDTSAIVGNAGLFTTVADLLRFAQNFGDGRVGRRDHLDAMQTPVSLGSNGTSTFGLGLEVGDDRGLKTVGHGGGDRGIAASLIRYPSEDLNVAVLCNLDDLNARVATLARQVAALYLPGRSEPATREGTPSAAAAHLTTAELAEKAGLYRDADTDTYGRVYVRDGKLWASMDAGDGAGDSVELRPIDANRFSVAGAPIVAEFLPPAGGRPRRIRVTGAGPKPFMSEQVREGFTPTAAQLQQYAGRYASADLAVTYTVVVRDSALSIRIPGRDDIPLTPVFRDAFYGPLVDLIRFSVPPDGPAAAFTINRSSARNLRFERTP